MNTDRAVQPSTSLPNSKRIALIRISIFLGVFVILQLCWQSLHGSRIDRVVVEDCTVRPAAYLVSLITPSLPVRAQGSSLHAPGGGLNILNGCEGIEALFLLAAAFVVAPISWRSRVLGMLCGGLLVFAINQIRVLVLFYAYRVDHGLFDRLHSTITPIAVVILLGMYFYMWLSHAASDHHDIA